MYAPGLRIREKEIRRNPSNSLLGPDFLISGDLWISLALLEV
jgi:hypothetical protein